MNYCFKKNLGTVLFAVLHIEPLASEDEWRMLTTEFQQLRIEEDDTRIRFFTYLSQDF